jgi:hypothetical protein
MEGLPGLEVETGPHVADATLVVERWALMGSNEIQDALCAGLNGCET